MTWKVPNGFPISFLMFNSFFFEDMDWKLCFICQQDNREALNCPLNADGVKADNLEAYKSFLENVKKLRENDCTIWIACNSNLTPEVIPEYLSILA